MTIADKLALLEQTKEAQRVKLGLPKSLPFSRYHEFFEYKFDPRYLFLNGEQGVWFDPSDLKTMYQDVSGLVPVTKDGEPVALIKDKSGNGNHAIQTTASARPIYRSGDGRGWVNNLINTEDFNRGGWAKARVEISITNEVKPPIKNVNVQKVIATGTAGTAGSVFVQQQYTQHRVGTSFISSVYLKAGTYTHARLSISQAANAVNSLTINLTTGKYTHKLPTDDVNFSHSVEHVGDGWYRVSITRKQTNYSLNHFVVFLTNYNEGSDVGSSLEEYKPKAGEYIYMAAPQFQIIPPGAEIPDNFILQPYQANREYLEGIATGLPTDLHWLAFDGVDDTLNVQLPTGTYTEIKASRDGVTHKYPINVSGTYTIGNLTQTKQSVSGLVLVNRQLTQAEIENVTNLMKVKAGLPL